MTTRKVGEPKEDFLLKLVEFDFEYVKSMEKIENEKRQIGSNQNVV